MGEVNQRQRAGKWHILFLDQFTKDTLEAQRALCLSRGLARTLLAVEEQKSQAPTIGDNKFIYS